MVDSFGGPFRGCIKDIETSSSVTNAANPVVTKTTTSYKTGQPENLEGMTYRPNIQTENNVRENNFASGTSLVTLIYGKIVSVEQQSTMWASGLTKHLR